MALGFAFNPASQITTRTISNAAYEAPFAAGVKSYTSNGLNQYSQVGGTNFTWDANGNLTSDGAITFAYDTENRLVSASGAKNGTLKYDPLGRLYEFTTPSPATTTRFVYDGDRLIAEYNGSGTLLRRYVHGAGVDEPLLWYEGATVSAAQRQYLHADHQGSIIAVSKNTGVKFQVNSYDAYGQTAATNTARFQYTGQAAIPELGLLYYKARFYNPALGRFMQTDPIGYEDDNNLYAYVGNDPLNRTDPSGLKCEKTEAGPACRFDEFRDKNHKLISREEATTGGSKLAKLLKMDPASRVARQEAAMTAKYRDALALKERGGSVTVGGNKSLGVQAQTISGDEVTRVL